MRSILKVFPDTETADEKMKRIDNVAQTKYEKIIAKRVANFNAIVDLDLKEGIQYRFVTTNAFNAVVVLELFSQKYTIVEILIAVYRMNLRSVHYLQKMLSDNKIKVTILLSSFFRENKKYERWATEMENFAHGDVGFSYNHAKVLLLRTSCGKHIVFEGSGNLSDNARIEQYLIENNKKMYDFHKQWINNEVRYDRTKPEVSS